jgi:hypothetical protein
MEKKDKAAYPEYYAQLEKDEKDLEKANSDDWDNESYNPWSTADDEDDDLKDEYQKPSATPSAPPPEVEKPSPSATEHAIVDYDNLEDAEDQSSVMPNDKPSAPEPEKTTEDLAREDEERSRTEK